MICTPHQVLFGRSNQEEEYMERGEVHTGFWWGNLRDRDRLEDLGIDGRVILRWFFRKWDVGAWSGLIWLWTGTGGRHL